MAKVGIIMGSKSDYPVMKEAEDILKEFKVDYEINIVSAHRTPEKMMDYSKSAHERGIKIIIAGAMAESCKKIFKSTYSISTTGNAGPKTNDSLSNVGQVFISVASKSGIFTEEFNFKGTRKEIIEQTVENAHKILYKNLIK